VQLHIVCDSKGHHQASYSKTWRRREIIDIIYALFHLKPSDNHMCLEPVCLPRLGGSLDLVKV